MNARVAGTDAPSPRRGGPELAVVVLSVGAPPQLCDALASLGRQSVPIEIAVVNSGGGDLSAARAVAPADTKFVEVPDRLLPGATRNRGVAATKAPIVAFMASDHILTENWCAARIARHRSGHPTVACAVINSNPRNLVAWAHHLAILCRRLPGVPVHHAALYGVSYDRSLFETHGMFREDLRIGEDTDFNERLPPEHQPVWAPEIQTIHQNATRLVPFFKDQYQRGWRTGYHWPLHKRGEAWIRSSVRRFTRIAGLAMLSVNPTDLLVVIASLPILFVGTLFYGRGLRAGYRTRIADGFTPDPGPAVAGNALSRPAE